MNNYSYDGPSEIDKLHARVGELEGRFELLEQGVGGDGRGKVIGRWLELSDLLGY